MKHYTSAQWGFELDIPERWNVFPGASNVTPYSVISFQSREDGQHRLGVLRMPHDPDGGEDELFDRVQARLVKLGASGRVGVSCIARGQSELGAGHALTVDFDMAVPERGIVHARQYYIIDGTLLYMLNFTTNKPDAMRGLFEQMAQSFAYGPASGV